MRAGVCGGVQQQALTPEAAAVVKQAVGFAKRQGHTQVTPIHVATAMLASSSANLLRAACRRTHSHPLHCKALELCFNVALNRLPTFSASSPLFGTHCTTHPSFSNALIAAFKRAQAHQRRGSVENQQQPILALKIEIEQLVVSILDDPSVSRVMREAGFSSPQVKACVEQAVSSDHADPYPRNAAQPKETTADRMLLGAKVAPCDQSSADPAQGSAVDAVSSDDVMGMLDAFMVRRRRNSVVVGECMAGAVGLARKVMERFRSGDVPGGLRLVEFMSFPLTSLRNLSSEEVERQLAELKRAVKRNLGRGVILYLGDLSWLSEFWASHVERRSRYCCSPVEHMVMELRRLVQGCVDGGGGRVWLMGIATFKTYMACKAGSPSLETIWELHPIAIPVGSLDLSLGVNIHLEREKVSDNKQQGGWAECLGSSEREDQSGDNNSNPSTTTKLPFWLQQCRNFTADHQEDGFPSDDKKWGSKASSPVRKQNSPEKAFTLFPSSSPASSISVSSHDRVDVHDSQNTILGWPILFDSNRLPKEHQFWVREKGKEERFQSGTKQDLLSNPNSSPNSASSSEVMGDTEWCNRFNEFGSERMETLCNALEKKAPWQRDIIPEIARTVLQGRSGMLKRKGQPNNIGGKEEVWLLFLGLDSGGKERIARELAKLIFGSPSRCVSICVSSFSSTRADSTDVIGNKRSRDELGQSYIERFAEAVCENPHRVFLMEDVEQADRCSQLGVRKAIQSGRIAVNGDEAVPLEDAIVIFSCESLSSVSRASSPPPPARPKSSDGQEDGENVELVEGSPLDSLDLNVAIEEDYEQSADADMEILDIVDCQIIFRVHQK